MIATKNQTATRNERVKNAVKVAVASAAGVGAIFVWFALIVAT
jgi:hypothetical protein